MPDALDGLCDADVVGLERVQSDAQCYSGGAKQPHGDFVDGGDAVRGEVVDDAGSEPLY